MSKTVMPVISQTTLRAYSRIGTRFETDLRLAVRRLWEITPRQHRKNIVRRMQAGKLTHENWSDATTGCTCLVGSVQPIDTPPAELLHWDREIGETYFGMPRSDVGERWLSNPTDVETIRTISDGWEEFVKRLGMEAIGSMSADRWDTDPRWYEVYDMARLIVLSEIAAIQAESRVEQAADS